MVYATRGIQIGLGTKEQMEAYAERMNKQAPQYNHRVEEVE